MGNNHPTPTRPISSIFKKKKDAPPRRQEYQELSALHPTQEVEDGGAYDPPPVVEDTNPVITNSDTSETVIPHDPREATPEREKVVRLETVEEEEGIIWTSPPSPTAAFNSSSPAPEGSHAPPALPISSATAPKGKDIKPPSPSPRGNGAPAPGAQSPSTGTSFRTPPGPLRQAPTPPPMRHTSGIRSSLFNSSSSGYAPILESESESSSPDTRRVVPTAERNRRMAFSDPRPPFLALIRRRNSSGATVTPATATMGGHPTGDSPPDPTPSQQVQPGQQAQGHPEATRSNPARNSLPRNSLPARHRRADSQPDIRSVVNDTGRANFAIQDDEEERFPSALYPSAGRQRSRSVSRSSERPLIGDNSPARTVSSTLSSDRPEPPLIRPSHPPPTDIPEMELGPSQTSTPSLSLGASSEQEGDSTQAAAPPATPPSGPSHLDIPQAAEPERILRHMHSRGESLSSPYATPPGSPRSDSPVLDHIRDRFGETRFWTIPDRPRGPTPNVMAAGRGNDEASTSRTGPRVQVTPPSPSPRRRPPQGDSPDGHGSPESPSRGHSEVPQILFSDLGPEAESGAETEGSDLPLDSGDHQNRPAGTGSKTPSEEGSGTSSLPVPPPPLGSPGSDLVSTLATPQNPEPYFGRGRIRSFLRSAFRPFRDNVTDPLVRLGRRLREALRPSQAVNHQPLQSSQDEEVETSASASASASRESSPTSTLVGSNADSGDTLYVRPASSTSWILRGDSQAPYIAIRPDGRVQVVHFRSAGRPSILPQATSPDDTTNGRNVSFAVSEPPTDTIGDTSADAGSQDAAGVEQREGGQSSNQVSGDQGPDDPNTIVQGYDVDSPANQEVQPSTHPTQPAPHNTGDLQHPRAGPSTNQGVQPSYPLARPTINGHSSALSPIAEGDSSGADTGEASSTESLVGLSDESSDDPAGPSATMLFDNGSRFYEHFTPTASQEALRRAGEWAPRGPVRRLQSPGGSCPNLRDVDYNDECETDRRMSYPKLYPGVYAPNEAVEASPVIQVNQDSQDLYEQLILSAHVDAIEEIEREWAEVCGEDRLLDVRNSLPHYLDNPLEEPQPPEFDLSQPPEIIKRDMAWAVGSYMAELYEHYRQRLDDDGLCFRSLEDADEALPEQFGPGNPWQSTGGRLKGSESSSSGNTPPSKDLTTSDPDYDSGLDACTSCTSEVDEHKDWVYYTPGLWRAPHHPTLDAFSPVQSGQIATTNYVVGIFSLGAEDHGYRFQSVDHDMEQQDKDEAPDASPKGSHTRRRSSSRDTFGNPRTEGANPPPPVPPEEEVKTESNNVEFEGMYGGGSEIKTEDNSLDDRNQHQHEGVEPRPVNLTSRRRASSLPVGNVLLPQYPPSPSDGRSPTPTLLPSAAAVAHVELAEAAMFASPAVSSAGSLPSTTFQPLEALPSPMALPSLGTVLDEIGLPSHLRPSPRPDTPSDSAHPRTRSSTSSRSTSSHGPPRAEATRTTETAHRRVPSLSDSFDSLRNLDINALEQGSPRTAPATNTDDLDESNVRVNRAANLYQLPLRRVAPFRVEQLRRGTPVTVQQQPRRVSDGETRTISDIGRNSGVRRRDSTSAPMINSDAPGDTRLPASLLNVDGPHQSGGPAAKRPRTTDGDQGRHHARQSSAPDHTSNRGSHSAPGGGTPEPTQVPSDAPRGVTFRRSRASNTMEPVSSRSLPQGLASPFVSTPLMALDQAFNRSARGMTEPPAQVPTNSPRDARFRRSRASSMEETVTSRMWLQGYATPLVCSPWKGGIMGTSCFTTYGDDIVAGPSSQPMARAHHLSSGTDLVGRRAAQEEEDIDMGDVKEEQEEQSTRRKTSTGKRKKRATSKDSGDKEDDKCEGQGSNSA